MTRSDAKREATRHVFTEDEQERGLVAAQAARQYRCVYCKRTMVDAHALPPHEAQCDARFVMQRMWARAIAKARQRDRSEGRR